MNIKAYHILETIYTIKTHFRDYHFLAIFTTIIAYGITAIIKPK